MAYNRNQKHRNHSSTNQRGDKPRKQFRKKLGRHEFFVEGNPSGVKVPDASTGTLERALKYLKRQMKDSDTIGKLRANKEFIKPSAKRRKQMQDAVRKQQLRDKISKEYWDKFTWIVPPSKDIGPDLPL